MFANNLVFGYFWRPLDTRGFWKFQFVWFLTILKISDFCQKIEFWVFWGVIGHSGSLEMSIFLVFGRSQNFDFLGFFWSVWKFWWAAMALCLWVSVWCKDSSGLVAHPPNHMIKMAQYLIQNSIFDDFENFWFLSKNWCLNMLGGHWTLGDSGNFNFFDF